MMDNLRRNIKFSILLFCIILGLFFVSASYEKNSNRLPLFDLEIPQPSEKMFMSSMDFDESEMKVIITLNNPDEIWKNEVSSMSSLDLKNLKTIMRLYVIDSNDLETKHKFNSFNGFSATISQQEYSGLLNNPLVKSITVDEEVSILMQDTIDLVNATSSWNLQVDGMNLTGAGQSVCVIDTGVDYTHPDLGGCDKIYDVIIDEEYLNTSITSPNFSNNYSDNFSLSLMGEITIPGADSIQVFFDEFDVEFWDTVYLGNGEGELYWMYYGDLGSFWSEEILGETISVFFMSDESINHKGFNISMARANFINSSDCDKVIGGIDYAYQSLDPMDVQGHGTHCAGTVAADGGIKGVAPDAKLVAVKSLDNTGSGRISDIIAGIEFCTENAEKYNISVISMSLGGGINYSSYCDVNLSVYPTAINNAVLNNISVVVATGNSANLTHISAPACIENAIRVGSSVKDDNALSGFSNRWLLDMLVAPGSSITSTCVGGVACAKSGTSMATPHVAGAIAILNQYSSLRNNLKTPYEINQILINSGKQINDSLTEINYSRLDIYSALMLLDEYPPLIEIYSPQDTIYNYTEILINITAEDDLSLDSIWYNWNGTNYTYTTELNITFDEGDHVLHAWANDTAGNINYTNVSFTICIENISNSSWSEWINLSCSGEQMNQSKYLTEYDINGCGFSSNITHYEYQLVGPEFHNTSSIWSDIGCVLNDMNQTRNITQYDSYNCVSNATFFEYRNLESNLTYTIWSEWDFISCINQTHANYSSNRTHYDSENVGCFTNQTESNYSIFESLTCDITPPIIEIKYPENMIYNNATQLLNISAIDNVEIDSVWFNFNGSNVSYEEFVYVDFDEGDHVLHAWANDTAGNINYTNVSFFIDSLAPEIIINTPLNISYNYSQNLLNITAYDVNLDSVWFNFNGSNISYEESVYVDFDQGDHILHAWANDTAGNINYTNVSFKIDTTPPYYIDIITKISYIYNATANHWFNVSLFDLSGVDTAKFYLTYPNNTIVDFVMLNDDDIWYFNISNLSYGDYSYYLWANDTVGNKDNLTKVSSFTIYENFNDTYQTEINDSNFEVPENVTLIFVETDNVLGNVTISQNNSNGINLSFINRPDNVINFANKTIFNRSINVSKNLVVEIFANTTMVVDGLWDGSFILPELIDININSSINVSLALKIGSNNNISFNQPVKVLLPGQAGKNVAWMSNGEDLNEIVILCDDPVIPNITEGSCKINSTFGDDLIVWTYHFTNFIAYEEIQDDDGSNDGSNGGSNGGSDNGGGSVTGSTVDVCISSWVCGDWGECINGYQSRTCNDQNNCNPSIPSRPEERKRCFLPSSTDDDVNFTVNFTEEIIDENHLSQDNTELNSGSEDDGLSSLSTEHTSDDEMKIDNDLEKTAYLSEIDRGKILWISMIGIFLFITVSTIFLVVKKNSYNDDFDLNFSKVQKILDNEKTSLWQKMFSLRKEKDPVYKSIIDKETYSKLYNENKNKK
jgi:subtilisin family serine protease